LKSWNGLVDDIKNDKIIQILAYAFMYETLAKEQPMQAGIISFKNSKAGFLPFTLKEEKTEESTINAAILSAYLEQLVGLLQEILDPAIPFKEKV